MTVVKISQLWATKILLLKIMPRKMKLILLNLLKKIITGDADENEIVDINDVTYLQRHIAGNKNTDELPLIDESNKDVFESVDLNKDGKL